MTPDQLAKLCRYLRATTYEASMAFCTHGGTRYQEKWLRMKDPRPGDLVVEISTAHIAARDVNAVGYLEKIAQEPVALDDPHFEWDVEKDGPWPTEKAYHITTLDGRPYRWVNATFIAALDSM